MKHTVNGRASICTWELYFSFRDKDQVDYKESFEEEYES